jgi:hypothetical protein
MVGVLVAQPFEDPLGRMTLLLATRLVVFQNLIDGSPHCSMTSAINGFTELEILAQRNKPPAVREQSESDLQHPLAHPPELLQ